MLKSLLPFMICKVLRTTLSFKTILMASSDLCEKSYRLVEPITKRIPIDKDIVLIYITNH